MKVFTKRTMMQSISMIAVTVASLTTFAGERVDKSMDVAGASQVYIENQRGVVSIQGYSGDTIELTGTLDDKAEELVFKKQGNRVKVIVEVPRQNGYNNNRNGSNLVLKVPQQLGINFEGVSSDVAVNNIESDVYIKTISGDISAQKLLSHADMNSVSGNIKTSGLQGKINLHSVSGNITDEQSTGKLSITVVSGDIETQSSAQDVRLEAISGNIEAKLTSVSDLEMKTISGDADVTLALEEQGTAKMSSVSGDYTLEFEGDIDADFRLKTSAGGNIKNRLTNDKATKGKYVPSSKLSFTVGDGSGSVRGSTVSGSFTLNK